MQELIQQIKTSVAPLVLQHLSTRLSPNDGSFDRALTVATSTTLNKLKEKVQDPVTHADELQMLLGFMKKADNETTPPAESASEVLQALFGKEVGQVASEVAEKSGINPSMAGQLLRTLAPLVLSFLGKRLGGENGLGSLLSALGVSDSSALSQIEGLLSSSGGGAGAAIDMAKKFFSF